MDPSWVRRHMDPLDPNPGIRDDWHPSTVTHVTHGIRVSQGRSTRCIGDGKIPPLIGNPYNGYINPYYWVDDHPLLYGNHGS